MCYDPKTKTVTGFGESKGLNSNIVRVVYALSDGSVLVDVEKYELLME